jgi:hypothetical protein
MASEPKNLDKAEGLGYTPEPLTTKKKTQLKQRRGVRTENGISKDEEKRDYFKIQD